MLRPRAMRADLEMELPVFPSHMAIRPPRHPDASSGPLRW